LVQKQKGGKKKTKERRDDEDKVGDDGDEPWHVESRGESA